MDRQLYSTTNCSWIQARRTIKDLRGLCRRRLCHWCRLSSRSGTAKAVLSRRTKLLIERVP